MRLFGFDISRSQKALTTTPVTAYPADDRGWWRIAGETTTGSWQKDVKVDQTAVQAFHAVFSCQTLIASDIAKLRVKLMELDANGIWSETTNPAYSPVLRKPNGFQTRNQFWESWMLSKLSHGNTYALKSRDGRGVVTALHVLDPCRVTPLVTEMGDVYYQLATDYLAGVEYSTVTVPAREIIHDRFNCLFHPLVGISPIFACGLAATQGQAIQNTSAKLFRSGAKPGGILTAPGRIDQEAADRLKAYWDGNFSGDNAGKIAVLGDGLTYEGLATNAVDSQLIEQLGWTSQVVCSTFHVPPYKIGVGALPSYNNVQALNVEYYSQCLQALIEAAEVCMDEGLATGEKLGTEFDIDNLLRMDGVTQMDVLAKSAGILEIDEMRAKLDRKPVTGGNAVYLQQQNYSLAALAKRDASDNPMGTPQAKPPAATPAPEDKPEANDNDAQLQAERALRIMAKGLPSVRR